MDQNFGLQKEWLKGASGARSKKRHAADLRIIKRMCCVTRIDKIRNWYKRVSLKVAPITEKWVKGDPLSENSSTCVSCPSQNFRLGVCQWAMKGNILGVKRQDKTQNTTLRFNTGIMDIEEKAARLKWDWVGLISRMHDDPPSPLGRPGRPRKIWRDDLDPFRKDWFDVTREKNSWKD